jgi:hypothetical protein
LIGILVPVCRIGFGLDPGNGDISQMLSRVLTIGLICLLDATSALADATFPTKDIAGARDNPLLQRYEGSFIVSYERVAFTDFKLPLSKLEPVDGSTE